jgi:hypothetical protein
VADRVIEAVVSVAVLHFFSFSHLSHARTDSRKFKAEVEVDSTTVDDLERLHSSAEPVAAKSPSRPREANGKARPRSLSSAFNVRQTLDIT